MKLPMIPHDKCLHVVYGAVIAAAVLVAHVALPTVNALQAPLLALAVVAAIGAIKELLDRRDPAHTADPMDFLATVAGGAIVVAHPLLIQL